MVHLLVLGKWRSVLIISSLTVAKRSQYHLLPSSVDVTGVKALVKLIANTVLEVATALAIIVQVLALGRAKLTDVFHAVDLVELNVHLATLLVAKNVQPVTQVAIFVTTSN